MACGSPVASDAKSASSSTLRDGSPDESAVDATMTVTHDAFPLRVTVHALRVLGVVVGFVTCLTTAICLLHRGRVVYRFKNGLADSDRKPTLDYYNSISGGIVSAFEKPIALVSSMLVAVVLVSLVPQGRFKIGRSTRSFAVVMAVQFGVAYMLANGFSALNVQLEDGELTAVMTDADLSAPITLMQSNGSIDTVLTPRTRGMAIHITDTVMRNALKPFDQAPLRNCAYAGYDFSPSSVTFGFALKTWQKDMLSQGVNSSASIKITAAPSSASTTTRLPMNDSVAANLLLYGLKTAPYMVPLWPKSYTVENHYNPAFDNRTAEDVLKNPLSRSAMDIFGLLQPDASTAAATTRWFLNRSRVLFVQALSNAENVSTSKSSMTFEVVQLGPNISMEALSFEFVLRKDWLSRTVERQAVLDMNYHELSIGHTNFSRNMTEDAMEVTDYFYQMDTMDDCAVDMPVCAVFAPKHQQSTIPGEISATRICLNEQGTEELMFKEYVQHQPNIVPHYLPLSGSLCNSTSNTSFFVLSASSRIVGDALSMPDSRLVNPRKIFTFTIARVSWQLQDLSELYNSRCQAEHGCMGLRFELENNTNNGHSYTHLLMGHHALPLGFMPALPYGDQSTMQAISLVSLTSSTTGSTNSVSADVAMPHHFDTVVSKPANDRYCSAKTDTHLNDIIRNRMFMDGELQPVYTAAMFFLFQNAAVKEQVLASVANKRLMLKLDTMVQQVDVVASIPRKNALLTLCGCGLLLLTCLAVVCLSWAYPTRLQEQVDADTAVRVVVNQNRYPSWLLSKHISPTDDIDIIISDDENRVTVLEERQEAGRTPTNYKIERVAFRRVHRSHSNGMINLQ